MNSVEAADIEIKSQELGKYARDSVDFVAVRGFIQVYNGGEGVEDALREGAGGGGIWRDGEVGGSECIARGVVVVRGNVGGSCRVNIKLKWTS